MTLLVLQLMEKATLAYRYGFIETKCMVRTVGFKKVLIFQKASFDGLSNELLIFYMTAVKRSSKLKLDKCVTNSIPNYMQELRSDGSLISSTGYHALLK